VTPDERRLEELARTHGPRVLAYLARRISPREDAADVWQQTLVTTWRKIHAVPSRDEEALPWLLAVARGELSNHRRSTQRRLAATDRLRATFALGEPTAYDSRTGVRDALATLDETDREIITLTYWDGLTSEQVGAVVGMRAGTVRKRLERARTQLAATLRLPSQPEVSTVAAH
jgi:RNA polymerase sigma-70 factor (ECF subfamily)